MRSRRGRPAFGPRHAFVLDSRTKPEMRGVRTVATPPTSTPTPGWCQSALRAACSSARTRATEAADPDRGALRLDGATRSDGDAVAELDRREVQDQGVGVGMTRESVRMVCELQDTWLRPLDLAS
jgi:hypothetical protein